MEKCIGFEQTNRKISSSYETFLVTRSLLYYQFCENLVPPRHRLVSRYNSISQSCVCCLCEHPCNPSITFGSAISSRFLFQTVCDNISLISTAQPVHPRGVTNLQTPKVMDGLKKTYQCSYCPYAFNAPSHLRRHVQCHLGIKPFTCSFCGQKFSRKDSMQYHMASQHNFRYA